MIKIGLFAKIGQVSIDALRHYDRLGLLKPSEVDALTGYRYYALEQLPRLHRILAFKDMGLPLEQIAVLLNGDISADEMRGMLRLRQAQLREALSETAAQLAQLDARLIELERENQMSNYEVLLKTVEPALVAGRRFILKENKEPEIENLGLAFDEARDYVRANGKEAGPPIAVWYTPLDQHMDHDVEAAFPLTSPVPETERIKVHSLPDEHVASVMHTGDFRHFGQAYEAITRWIIANRYEQTGPFRELYHKFDRHDTTDVVVEVQFPVRRKQRGSINFKLTADASARPPRQRPAPAQGR